MQDRIESLIGGLENCIENAKLRGDAYDVGYMSAMVTEARALLADGGKDSSDARDAERYRWLRDQNANSSGAFAVIEDDGGFSSWDACWVGEELDDAIDAAIAGEKK
jgi:hypothetical protein